MSPAVQIPTSLLKVPLSGSALRFWILLRAWPDGIHSEYAEFLGTSSLMIRRAIRELKDAGILKVDPKFDTRTGGRVGNIYTLIDPSTGQPPLNPHQTPVSIHE